MILHFYQLTATPLNYIAVCSKCITLNTLVFSAFNAPLSCNTIWNPAKVTPVQLEYLHKNKDLLVNNIFHKSYPK
jgi:hypothetical protein